MKQRLFNLAAAISLLLCVAMIGLMLCGLWRVDTLAKYTWDPQQRILSRTEITFTGNLSLRGRSSRGLTASRTTVDQLVSRLDTAGEMQWRHWPDGAALDPRFLSFHYDNNRGVLTNGLEWKSWVIAIPYWPLVLLSGITPLVWLVAFKRKRRRDFAGRCLACGYDLRATPERCPECGTISDGAKACLAENK